MGRVYYFVSTVWNNHVHVFFIISYMFACLMLIIHVAMPFSQLFFKTGEGQIETLKSELYITYVGRLIFGVVYIPGWYFFIHFSYILMSLCFILSLLCTKLLYTLYFLHVSKGVYNSIFSVTTIMNKPYVLLIYYFVGLYLFPSMEHLISYVVVTPVQSKREQCHFLFILNNTHACHFISFAKVV